MTARRSEAKETTTKKKKLAFMRFHIFCFCRAFILCCCCCCCCCRISTTFLSLSISLFFSLSTRGACLAVSLTLFGFEYLFYWLRNLRVPLCASVCVCLLVVSVEICSKFKMWNLSERKPTLFVVGAKTQIEK